ncbi:unnamed protein product [Schistosoma mattheei]|uniref:Uncharacterized protein n=1 Tax=Schistosoma mattheei TaxID=31246 RepID=A0A183PAV4_9TREM|nr:unnamed protein product [Schistosoma mattheei]
MYWTSGQTTIQRFKTDFLRHANKLNEFNITLNNRSHILLDLPKEEETIMEDNWKGIKGPLTSTCHEVLGRKKHHHKKYIPVGNSSQDSRKEGQEDNN